MATEHIPVLLNESLQALAPAAGDGGIIVDCTLGAGGHTAAFLANFPRAKVLACDVDASAIARARERLGQWVSEGRLEFFHGNFSTLVDEACPVPSGWGPPWTAVFADLGYSSIQLESAEFGMSFQIDAPLDMRLTRPPVGQTAWELLCEEDEENLARILGTYGEIQGAGRLARILKQAIASGELENSTKSIAGLSERISGGRNARKSRIHPATQLFQALRIAVNDELRVLDHLLEGVILRVRPSGVVAVITFHSLEDRLVKRWGRKNTADLDELTRKPLEASEDEIERNPRARSAKLRSYQRRNGEIKE